MSYYTQMQEGSSSVPFEKNYKRIKLTEDWLKDFNLNGFLVLG